METIRIFYPVLCLLWCTVTYPAGCQSAGVDRIVGGSPAPLGVAPYQASLLSLTGTNVCGGAILSSRAIMSAAHCFLNADGTNVNPEYIVILVGTNNLSLLGQTHSVSQIISHEEYDRNSKENDLAILITVTKITMNENTKPIAIWTKYVRKGAPLTLTGFGALSSNTENVTSVMQIIQLNDFDMETCKYAYRNVRPLFDSQLCTFTSAGEGSCYGDSGAPLVLDFYKDPVLVGIASFGIPCAAGYPDVFTRISAFVDWIQLHVPDL